MRGGMDLSDHELMERCRAGETAAFEQLVRRWEGRVARVLARLTGLNGEVDDLCQEVFVRILRALDRYEPCAAFSTWLYRIVLNVARDAGRRQRWRWRPLGDHQPPGHGQTPLASASQRELGQQVASALLVLPPALREALTLRHFAELTFAEIAAVTGVPASTMKSRVHAALTALRAELRRRGIDERELEP